MEPARYFDNHTICVFSPIANNQQLLEVVNKAIADVSIQLGRHFPGHYCANLVHNRENVYQGFGYLWVTNPEVYHLLLGRNPDGSERYEEVPADEPDEPSPIVFQPISVRTRSWADEIEEEEKSHPPPKRIPLPSLVTLPPFNLTAEQINSAPIGVDGVKPTTGTFEMTAGYVIDVENSIHNVIVSSTRLPPWVTEKDIKNIFTPYTSNPRTPITKRVAGKVAYGRKEDTYPCVHIDKRQVASITFDDKTRDAQFALLMAKKVFFRKDKNKAWLTFTLASRRDPTS